MRLILTTIFFLNALAANAVVIDFSEYEVGEVLDADAIALVSEGYVFRPEAGTSIRFDGPQGGPTPELLMVGSEIQSDPLHQMFMGGVITSTITMSQEDGLAFDLLSFDMARPLGRGILDYTLVGTKSAGGQVNFDGLAISFPDGVETPGTLPDFSAFNDLVAIEFTVVGAEAFLGLDDIAVSTVPIPAAVWLFGSGLGLLGWFRRRQSA
jgi:hypothetical protein